MGTQQLPCGYDLGNLKLETFLLNFFFSIIKFLYWQTIWVEIKTRTKVKQVKVCLRAEIVIVGLSLERAAKSRALKISENIQIMTNEQH